MGDFFKASGIDSIIQNTKIKVAFTHKFATKQFENEDFYAETEVVLEGSFCGAERIFIEQKLGAELEWAVYTKGYYRKLMTETEYNERVVKITENLKFAGDILRANKPDSILLQ